MIKAPEIRGLKNFKTEKIGSVEKFPLSFNEF